MLSSWEASSASFPLNRVCHQPIRLFLRQAAAAAACKHACMHINGYYDTSAGVACQRGLRVGRARELSWNWHAFYMLCDPAWMFHEQQPVFHVQVSTGADGLRGDSVRTHTHRNSVLGEHEYRVVAWQAAWVELSACFSSCQQVKTGDPPPRPPRTPAPPAPPNPVTQDTLHGQCTGLCRPLCPFLCGRWIRENTMLHTSIWKLNNRRKYWSSALEWNWIFS